ncbi:MAG: hypothetical protein LBM98_04890 [Oscillospiraceae bacterium]|nr:hypothetical protein [Oscillospiraceae bacterium]
MRYVPVKPARQNTAGSVTYVCFPPGTGLPRAYTSYVSQVRWRSQRRRTAPGRRTQDTGRRTHPTSKPYPLCGGVPPQGRGGFPAAADVAYRAIASPLALAYS